MIEAMSVTLYWVIIPGIMLAVWTLAIVVLAGAGGELRTSASAGFWAGHVAFVAYVISQLPVIREPSFTFSKMPEFLVAPIGLGSVVGFIFLWAAKLLAPTRLVGVLTLVLSLSSSSALFSYVFMESLRTPTLSLTLGTAFGALLHRVFFPAAIGAREEVAHED